jgi:hypothetical protein
MQSEICTRSGPKGRPRLLIPSTARSGKASGDGNTREGDPQGLEIPTTDLELLANSPKLIYIIARNPNGHTVPENFRTILEIFFEHEND